MVEKRIIETMESIFEWLSQSDATSLEEDEDFAKAIEIVKQAAAKRAPADIEAPERAEAESRYGAHDPKLNKALVRAASVYLKHAGVDILDSGLVTSAGEPVVAIRDENVLGFALLRRRTAADDDSPVRAATACREIRRRMEDVFDRYLETVEEPSSMKARFDLISIMAFEKCTSIKHIKNAWSAKGSSHICGEVQEQLAALVDEYRGTEDCLEGCHIADAIVALIESEVLRS